MQAQIGIVQSMYMYIHIRLVYIYIYIYIYIAHTFCNYVANYSYNVSLTVVLSHLFY